MICHDNTLDSDDYYLSERNGQCSNTVNLLKLMRHDYQGARKQLEQISLQLAEREALVNQHLQHVFLSSQGYHTLCLTEYQTDASVNRMGDIVLGEVVLPARVPSLTNIEVYFLGRFEVRSSIGQVDRWNSIKAKSVFQYLLMKPHQPTTREALMEALWPECTPQAAGNNLKAAVHNLRLTLNALFDEPESMQYIIFRQGSYLLNPEINLWTDVELFENCWAAGRKLEKEQKPAEALREFEKAEALYRGDYLEDETYEEWTLLRREALKDTYLMILSKLADHSLQIADYESCIHYSQKILAGDNCREDTYRRLMYCYAKLGQRNRALRWYDICCQTNKAELDAMPDNETSNLYYKILKDEAV